MTQAIETQGGARHEERARLLFDLPESSLSFSWVYSTMSEEIKCLAVVGGAEGAVLKGRRMGYTIVESQPLKRLGLVYIFNRKWNQFGYAVFGAGAGDGEEFNATHRIGSDVGAGAYGRWNQAYIHLVER